jgi:YD repeat-containing protein
MTTRATPADGTQTLTWNAAGQLTQVSGGTGGTTSYIYAPDGSLLVQANPGKTTVYLDGEQLTRL